MAKNVRTLTFDLFAKNNTGKAFGQVGSSAQKMGKLLSGVGKVAAAGFAVAGAAALAFGISSVKAFAEAQAAQERLNFAYAKFPLLADATRASFDTLNRTLQAKTGFDDDMIASSQGVLAQFGLTGTQIQKLTPLLLDYARANGKDLTTSAEDFGKALLGQGRALKTIGLDFDDAGSTAANYDQLLSGLTTNVGGYAEQFGTTAAGKFEILTAKWGDFQEQVGEALLPGLVKLMDFAESDVLPHLTDFADWFGTDGVVHIKTFMDEIARLQKDGILVPAVIGGIGAITLAQIGLNAAMLANPIGLVVVALGILVGQFAYVLSHLEDFKLSASDTSWGVPLLLMFTGWAGIVAFFVQNWDIAWYMISLAVTTNINQIIDMINLVATPLNALLDAINFLTGSNFTIKIPYLSAPKPPAGFGLGTSQPAAGPQSGMVARPFAEGGLVRGGRGGVFAMIGEKAHDELVVPLKPGMGGLGGTTVVVNVNGSVLSDERKIAVAVRNALKNQRGQGLSMQGAFV